MICEECETIISNEENSNTVKHPICGVCWDKLHQEQFDEFSDADIGL